MAPRFNRSRVRRPSTHLTSHYMHTVDSFLFGVVMREPVVPVGRAINHWLTGRRLLYIAAGLLTGLLVAQFLVPHLVEEQFLREGADRRGRSIVLWGVGGLLVFLCLQFFAIWALSHRNALADAEKRRARSQRGAGT